MEDGVVLLGAHRQPRLDCGGWLALDVEPDQPPPAAKRLLFATVAADGRMPMFRPRLAREEYELLGAIAVGVDVDDDLQPGPLQFGEAKIRHLDSDPFLLCQSDACQRQHRRRPGARYAWIHALAHKATPLILSRGP